MRPPPQKVLEHEDIPPNMATKLLLYKKLAPSPLNMPLIPCICTVFLTTSTGPRNSFGTWSGCTSCSWSLHLIVSVGCATVAFVQPAKRPASACPDNDSRVGAPSSVAKEASEEEGERAYGSYSAKP